MFFLDLPGEDEKPAIWQTHRRAFGLPDGQPLPNDAGWTGAEIRCCCRLAARLEVSLVEAAQGVAPVAVTAAETAESLRAWAGGRCVDAARPGLYAREGTGKARRQLERDPDLN